MRILALDLGKFKSVVCVYQLGTGDSTFQTLPTTPILTRSRSGEPPVSDARGGAAT